MLRALIVLIMAFIPCASLADAMRDCTEGATDATISGCSKAIAEGAASAFLAVALANRAHAYQQKKEDLKAIADLDSAVTTDPAWGFLYRERGGAYARQGVWEKAREDLDKSTALDPRDAFAFYLSCQLWFQSANYDKAVEDCSRTIELDPHSVKGYVFRGQSYWFKGEYKEAADDFLRSVLMDRHTPQYYAMLGEAYFKVGDNGRAIEAFDNAILLEPELVGALVSRGKVYQADGDKEKAMADYRAALAFAVTDDVGRKLQREALDGLTALQPQAPPPPVSPGADVPAKGVTQSKRSMCRFADIDLRKKMGCDEP